MIIAAQLVETLYPDVRGTELSISMSEDSSSRPSSTDVRSFGLQIDNPEWHNPKDDSAKAGAKANFKKAKTEELPLYFTFDFIGKTQVGCHPVGFMQNKTSRRLEESQRVINAHPEWTDTQALAAAKQRGLAFGPENKEALLNQVPLKKLGAFFGPLRYKRMDFTITSKHDKDATSSFASLSWEVTTEEIGTTRVLGVVVDPFTGRITAIGESDKQDIKH